MIPVKITVNKRYTRLPSVDKDRLLRTVAESMLGDVRYRIHTDGIASDGNAIGNYSDPYLRHREKKGKGNDSRVIISFTRQMQNDFQIIETNSGYGLGYSNAENFNKVGYVEGTYDKKIFALTVAEKLKVKEIATDYIVSKLK